MPDVMILSPHCDDAPLSLGTVLLNRSLTPKPRVAVIFSVSRYTKDEPCTGCAETITALRNAEERKAAEEANYDVTFLGFGEPFVRSGFGDMDDIFDKSRVLEQDGVWAGVAAKIADLLAKHDGLTLSPLACGDHIDHRIVHRAVLEAHALGRTGQLGFYEDLPYSANLTEEEILCRVPSLRDNQLRPVVFRGSLERKNALLATYESQLEALQYEEVRQHWTRIGGERVWLPRDVAALFE